MNENNPYVDKFLDDTSQILFTVQDDLIKNLKIQLATADQILILERQRILVLLKTIDVLKQQLKENDDKKTRKADGKERTQKRTTKKGDFGTQH